MEKAIWTRHKMLRLPRKCETAHCKVLRLPQKKRHACIDTLASKVLRLPRKTKMTSHLVTLKRQNEHFVRDFLHFSYLKEMIVSHSARTAHRREIKGSTRTRRGDDDDTTNTTRTQVQPQTPTINGNRSLRIREKIFDNSEGGQYNFLLHPVCKYNFYKYLRNI